MDTSSMTDAKKKEIIQTQKQLQEVSRSMSVLLRKMNNSETLLHSKTRIDVKKRAHEANGLTVSMPKTLYSINEEE